MKKKKNFQSTCIQVVSSINNFYNREVKNKCNYYIFLHKSSDFILIPNNTKYFIKVKVSPKTRYMMSKVFLHVKQDI